jgi:hypothetical protein
MTLTADEQTVHDGQPRELYDFTIQGATSRYYTDFRADLSVLSKTYLSVPISRSDIVGGGSESRPIEIHMPYNLALLDDLAFSVPPRDIKIEIRRYHGNIANVGLLWTGYVTSVRIVGRTATIRASSILGDRLDSPIPAVSYKPLCNHFLYDDRCTIDPALFKTSTTIASIGSDPKIITVNTIGGVGHAYEGGEVVRTSDGERRMILAQSGTQLTLMREFRSLAVGNGVDVYDGCDHTIDTCLSQFSNVVNFGGHPYIQTKDLFRFGVRGSGV